ncbi:MAG: hypothetical protein DRJ38_10575 [Thermoprotei archaeon]|nr:MAG: hypothetical protein DRJ38_10575 [Thermoprotei archaeon]
MSNSVNRYKEDLGRIHLTIILTSDLITSLTHDVVGEVEKLGLKAMIRADGYAFMKSSVVGELGLPHLRYAIIEDRAMVWVRAPYKLSEELLALAGFNVKEYCEEIIRAAREIAKIFKKYEDKAVGLNIELPEL